jgi:SAM-dependent methyltransferase
MEARENSGQPGQPATGDALGEAFLDAMAGRPQPVVVERDDGFVTVDGIQYLGALDERDEWAVGQLAGRVVDVGAGAGRGALALQARGQPVTALDSSPGAARACRQRGVRDVYHGTPGQAAADGLAGGFDSALLLGNNIGLLGSREAAGPFLAQVGALLRPGGIIVGTASDPYRTDQRVHLDYHERNRLRGRLPGHATIRVRYQRLATGWFDWLIPSPGELEDLARPVGWQITSLRRGPGAPYAVVLCRIGGEHQPASMRYQ